MYYGGAARVLVEVNCLYNVKLDNWQYTLMDQYILAQRAVSNLTVLGNKLPPHVVYLTVTTIDDTDIATSHSQGFPRLDTNQTNLGLFKYQFQYISARRFLLLDLPEPK